MNLAESNREADMNSPDSMNESAKDSSRGRIDAVQIFNRLLEFIPGGAGVGIHDRGASALIADAIQVSRSNMTQSRQRNSIPDAVVAYCIEQGISLDYVYGNHKALSKREAEKRQDANVISVLSDAMDYLEKMIQVMDKTRVAKKKEALMLVVQLIKNLQNDPIYSEDDLWDQVELVCNSMSSVYPAEPGRAKSVVPPAEVHPLMEAVDELEEVTEEDDVEEIVE